MALADLPAAHPRGRVAAIRASLSPDDLEKFDHWLFDRTVDSARLAEHMTAQGYGVTRDMIDGWRRRNVPR